VYTRDESEGKGREADHWGVRGGTTGPRLTLQCRYRERICIRFRVLHGMAPWRLLLCLGLRRLLCLLLATTSANRAANRAQYSTSTNLVNSDSPPGLFAAAGATPSSTPNTLSKSEYAGQTSGRVHTVGRRRRLVRSREQRERGRDPLTQQIREPESLPP